MRCSSGRRAEGPLSADARPSQDVGYERLKAVKLGDVRAVFSPARYQRSTPRAIGWLLFDFMLYGTALAGVFGTGNPVLRIASSKSTCWSRKGTGAAP